MQSLTIDPPVPFVLGPGAISVILVGCGGTGSHIAQSLARIAAHLRATPKELELVFVDGDTVEHKNVGRQLFTPADVGQNKAEALASRFNRMFGLSIGAVPQMATKTSIEKMRQSLPYSNHLILVGAVDTASARSVLATTVTQSNVSWLDCGNHEHSGQVSYGTVAAAGALHGAIKHTICTALPAPHLVYPELLVKAPARRRADCAAAMEDNVQSLMINQAMAAVAAQYLYQLIIQRRLTTFQTTLDLQTLAMRSTPITVRTLAAATGVREDIIDGSVQPSKKVQAA